MGDLVEMRKELELNLCVLDDAGLFNAEDLVGLAPLIHRMSGIL